MNGFHKIVKGVNSYVAGYACIKTNISTEQSLCIHYKHDLY